MTGTRLGQVPIVASWMQYGWTCNGTGTHVKPVQRSNWGLGGLSALAGRARGSSSSERPVALALARVNHYHSASTAGTPREPAPWCQESNDSQAPARTGPDRDFRQAATA